MSYEIITGDCLDWMREREAGSVDAVVADPPWMGHKTGWYDASEWHAEVEFVDPETYCSELFRVSRDKSAALLWCRWDCFDLHSAAMSAAGFSVRNQIVWAKPNHTAGDLDGNAGFKHECAVFAAHGDWKRHGPREVNLWECDHLFSRSARLHPTQKSVSLMRRSVEWACPPGGTVFDPFCGSGTTGVACIETGRNFVGIEINPEYADIARARCEKAERQPDMFVKAPKPQQLGLAETAPASTTKPTGRVR